ncbi:MAG: transposase [Bradyrhizobium sp.]
MAGRSSSKWRPRRRGACAAADPHRAAHEDAHAPGRAGRGDGPGPPAQPMPTARSRARCCRRRRRPSLTASLGPRAGQKVLTLRGAMPREEWVRQPLCADIDGFSLHAAVRVEARDRKRLEQLCRYITRPALSDERVLLNAAGQVERSSRRRGAMGPRTW